VFVSSDTSCLRFRAFELGRGKNNEESVVHLDRFMRISRDSGMPLALRGLERYMDTESLKEQFSKPGFYHLDVDGW
jgi:hypothetical protein